MRSHDSPRRDGDHHQQQRHQPEMRSGENRRAQQEPCDERRPALLEREEPHRDDQQRDRERFAEQRVDVIKRANRHGPERPRQGDECGGRSAPVAPRQIEQKPGADCVDQNQHGPREAPLVADHGVDAGEEDREAGRANRSGRAGRSILPVRTANGAVDPRLTLRECPAQLVVTNGVARDWPAPRPHEVGAPNDEKQQRPQPRGDERARQQLRQLTSRHCSPPERYR